MRSTRTLAIVLATALAAVAVWFLFLRGGKPATATATTGSASADDPWAKPAAPKKGDAPQQPAAPIFLRDADPVGALRLEGQVLDGDDHPVGGAEVWLASVPPRQTKTEEDGSFAFDKLVGRAYELAARKGDDVGGPIAYTLTAKSDPAVVRLRKGQTLTVTVTAAADGKAIAGAAVELRGLVQQRATAGADGKAVLHGVAPGWLSLVASANGFAPAHVVREIREGQTTLDVQLQRGAPVAGKVVDEHGKPVAKARVLARDVASLLPTGDPDRDGAVTAADGTFTIPSVPAGSYRFVATDDDHAPGSSEPITVDGTSSTAGVVIAMKAAAILTGRVITQDQQRAPYATIKVMPKDLDRMGGVEGASASSRQVVADADGTFSIRGLPRAALRVRAESDVAASAIADVDLTGAPPAELVLVLDVSGTIAGIVVDGDNQPVAEAQITSMTDIMRGGGKVEDLAISGFASAISDGGGRFALHGLPPGAYKLWAHRAGGTMKTYDQLGTSAKTGDSNVRLVLPTPGGITGKVIRDDGTPVTSGTVQTGFQTTAAIANGAFTLDDLVPGTYDLRIRGAEFAEQTKSNVKVEAGKTTDVGTITVTRGRRVTGRVVGPDGTPAAGATVMLGKTVLANGTGLGMGGFASDDRLGVRSTTTGDDGGFAIIGVGADGASAMADHPTLGRSDGVSIPPGTTDPAPVTLALHGFGSLGGKITRGGQPVSSATVTASEKNGGSSMILVQTGADGTYLIQKLPQGSYHVTVMRTAGFGASTSSGDTTVTAGTQSTLDIDIPVGDITLTVEVRGKAGAEVDGAEVLLMAGSVNVSNGAQLQDAYLHGGSSGGGVKFWLGGPDFPAFADLKPGAYSVCTVPLTGNMSDPRIGAALQAHADKLAVYCAAVTVTASPTQQKFVHEVPAMTPLPSQ